MLVHVIADYGTGDLAAAEVTQRIVQHLPDAQVCYVPVAPFDTVSAGFCVAQLALTDGPADRLVYCNVAPRADEDRPRAGNQGERLLAARVGAGQLVVGVDSGAVFGLLRPELDELFEVDFPDTGSQFRSRDAFPPLLPRLLAGDRDLLGAPVDPDTLPPAPTEAVLYTDGYGNLKTSWTEPPAEPGDRVTVTIGAATAVATVTDGTFGVAAGELSFAPGSSGWRSATGAERRWYELLLRGGNAAALLGDPASGTRIEVTPTPK